MSKRKRQHNPHRHARRMHYRAHNPHRGRTRHHRRRRHHNPFGKGLLPGRQEWVGIGVGAGGAVLTDVAMAYLPIPATLQTGWANLLTRAAVAIGVGALTGVVSNKRTGVAATAGGLIVVAYSGLKQVLAPTLGQNIKGLSGLADFGDYRPASPYSYGTESAAMQGAGMGAYMQPRMGAYMQRGMGAYMNPAAFLSAPAASVSPIAAKQRAMAGYGTMGGYDSDSM